MYDGRVAKYSYLEDLDPPHDLLVSSNVRANVATVAEIRLAVVLALGPNFSPFGSLSIVLLMAYVAMFRLSRTLCWPNRRLCSGQASYIRNQREGTGLSGVK